AYDHAAVILELECQTAEWVVGHVKLAANLTGYDIAGDGYRLERYCAPLRVHSNRGKRDALKRLIGL
ncbi:hypothetical protein OFN50_36270, partial [Escherichia coli]|nr:hypothetical protein [Escherichia coli]